MIEFKNVNMCYNKSTIVFRDMSVTINDEDFCLIYGKSGIGKSTFLNMVVGFEKRYTGEILVENIDYKKNSNKEIIKFRNNNFGILSQDIKLIDSIKTIDNVCLTALLDRKHKDLDEVYAKASVLLKKMGVNEVSKFPKENSGGEQRRVEIVRTIINDPKYIILDEPTANLDIESKKIIMDELIELNKNKKTIVICTHDKDIINEGMRIFEIKDYQMHEKNNMC